MNHGFEAAVLANDLDSMVYRIESLPPHPRYTEALIAVQRAREAIKDAAADIHQREMRERFAKMDAA